MKKTEPNLDLKKFEAASQEAWKAFQISCREIEQALDGKKTVTDKTKLAVVTMGNFAKLKGAEVHRMAMEIMVRRRNLDIPELPALTDGKGNL